MLAVLIGIVVIVIAVVTWLGHLTVNHALAVIIFIAGVSIILGALQGDRYHTRL
jgi:hypothetical protein